jgi:sec-independent protein translocase protein TatA
MSDSATSSALFALFSLGGGEVILVLALILILRGAKRFPDIKRGLGEGLSEFRKHLAMFPKELDQEAHGAGESLGGIYGKPAAQALTPDNQTAELYDPAVFQSPPAGKHTRFRGLIRLCRLIWHRTSKRLGSYIRISVPR